jgi:hypothetical protein
MVIVAKSKASERANSGASHAYFIGKAEIINVGGLTWPGSPKFWRLPSDKGFRMCCTTRSTASALAT